MFGMFKELSSEKFNYSPSVKKWSIAQIITHLLVAEQLSLGYMKKKSLGLEQLKSSGFKESFLTAILKISQRTPGIKFKAPQIVITNTPQSLSLPELSQRWEAHRTDLKNFLEKVEDKNVKKLIYKHPFVGMLDSRQALIFFREHIIHHLPQIKRCLTLNSTD
jgi:hypothetical protein